MKALFITMTELKRKSIIDGALDTDKLVQFVEVAQDVHIQNFLGTKLYDKIQTLITGGTLDDSANAAYKTLLNTYIKPMLIWYSQYSYIPFAAFQISNGGVFKHSSESSESVSKEELDSLTAKAKDFADFYTNRFVDYMIENSSSFPEYTGSQDEGMYPDKDPLAYGWVL
ncbi:MAG: hypothetical protein GOVbin40013_30 [Prokaryotic dsDNA virus sp.]|jgi:hypothetical protein|nr:MAG: hypothetical protein GOVbin40013_30 [Prokaryotic dsDNA virus sp.]|tara:strand:+ start:20716 stop:21225 length:510 start_codon:yes stop_codon:yes gene_type:complete